MSRTCLGRTHMHVQLQASAFPHLARVSAGASAWPKCAHACGASRCAARQPCASPLGVAFPRGTRSCGPRTVPCAHDGSTPVWWIHLSGVTYTAGRLDGDLHHTMSVGCGFAGRRGIVQRPRRPPPRERRRRDQRDQRGCVLPPADGRWMSHPSAGSRQFGECVRLRPGLESIPRPDPWISSRSRPGGG